MNQTSLGRKSFFETKTFSDLDLNFKTYTNGDLKIKDGENAVKQSILNLLLFDEYDKPFNPKISAGLRGMLFEPIEASTAISLQFAIQDILNTYEPRIKVENVSVVGVEEDHKYDITLTFSLINAQTSKTVEFFLERLR